VVVGNYTGSMMVDTDFLLNVVAAYPAISRVVELHWLDWLDHLQSHMCPLSVVMRHSYLMLAPCFFKFLNWELFTLFIFAPALVMSGSSPTSYFDLFSK